MPSIATKKIAFNSAEQFKESFSEASPTVAYICLGNHVPYANESSPDSIVETTLTEKQVWDNMFAAKRITGNDVQLVIPRYNWTANTKYKAFDDRVQFSSLFTENTAQNVRPIYVYTSERNVYKCLSNNNSANSTTEPTGDFNTSNGNIGTADGYLWKYMFSVTPSNKFLTKEWIPAPTSTEALDFGVDATGVVDGELTAIIVTDKGLNYRQASNIKVDAYASGQTVLKLTNTSLVLEIFSIPTLANLQNMIISGTGIPISTHIEDISITTGTINLSSTTTGAGGNTGNNISISTRVFIDGDGSGALANATLSNTSSSATSANANISKITITSIGTGYIYANAIVYGSGSGANARIILPTKYGHAFNPAKELNANNVMVAVRVGEFDSTENGVISTNTSFRQISLLRDPYKYGSSEKANNSTANGVISQTTNIDMIPGSAFLLNEFVYQGSLSNPSAYGYINEQTPTQIRVTKVKGTFVAGLLITGLTSGVNRTTVGIANPEFQPYSGDILYVTNEQKLERSDGQAENIKVVISF